MRVDGISIVDGNTKTGAVPAVSTTPIEGCPAGVPCATRDGCYACKFLHRPTVRAAWSDNLDAVRHDRARFFGALRVYLSKRLPRFFRWHVAGDIADAAYLAEMKALARDFPNTRFLAFTKRHSLNFRGLPANLTVVLSMWPGWGNTREKMPRAWMQDGTETRVPADAVECPGNCESCGMCWNLPRLGRDVVFEKH